MLTFDLAVKHSPAFVVADVNQLDVAPASAYVRYGKRCFDVVVSMLVCVFILSWLYPIVALLIKLTSPGPVLFQQQRTGRNGRDFRCLKFRTMRHKPRAGFVQCAKHDPRITAIGAFLRRSNLDEMPQFINVLLGEMSVVGPRPHAVEHDDRYWFVLPTYHLRYLVKPGITGLAQVRGARGETTGMIKMKHRVQYDMLYAKRQSLELDIKLCLGTMKGMVKGNVNAW